MKTFLPLQIFCWKISIMRHKKIKVSLEEGKSSKSQYLNCVSCVASTGSHRQVGTSDQPTAGPVAPPCVMTESRWMCCRHFINESCFLKLLLSHRFYHHCCCQVRLSFTTKSHIPERDFSMEMAIVMPIFFLSFFLFFFFLLWLLCVWSWYSLSQRHLCSIYTIGKNVPKNKEN